MKLGIYDEFNWPMDFIVVDVIREDLDGIAFTAVELALPEINDTVIDVLQYLKFREAGTNDFFKAIGEPVDYEFKNVIGKTGKCVIGEKVDGIPGVKYYVYPEKGE